MTFKFHCSIKQFSCCFYAPFLSVCLSFVGYVPLICCLAITMTEYMYRINSLDNIFSIVFCEIFKIISRIFFMLMFLFLQLYGDDSKQKWSGTGGYDQIFTHYLIQRNSKDWLNYCMPKKSWPILYCNLLSKMDQDFLDRQYN